MKVLMLGGVVVLSAVSSCNVAKATFAESNIRSEVGGFLTPLPGYGNDVDASYSVSNAAPNNTGYNYISINAGVENRKGDTSPVYQPPLLQASATVVKTFTWDKVGQKPVNATVSHSAKLRASLTVVLDATNPPPDSPYAKAQLFFDQYPGPVQGTEKGKFTSIARPDGGLGYTTYVYVTNENHPGYTVTPGQSVRTIGPTDSMATVTVNNIPDTSRIAVENRIQGRVIADARQIFFSTQRAKAQISGYIYTTLFALN